MATRTLSFQKRARNPFSTPAWESSYTSSSGADLLGAEYYAISYKFSPYNGSDVQSVTNIVFKAVLGGDWAQSCTYNLYLYSQDPAGYSQQPSAGLLTESGPQTKDSDTNVIQWTISGSYASYSTLYVLIMVDYGSGQVTLNHGNSSIVENYTAKAIPQISFGNIGKTDTGMSIPIYNGSNYNLTCTITAGTAEVPGNNALLYRGTSSNGVFNVPIDAVQWFNKAEITDSLVLPTTITVTGGNPSPISRAGYWQEDRQTEIDKMKPVITSLATQIQQAPGGATDYYPSTYIAGYSKCKVTAVITRPTLAGIYGVYLNYPGGATVIMEEDENNPGTYTGITAALTKDTEFTVSAVDMRNLRSDDSVQVTGVVAYVEPSVRIDLAYRCNYLGDETSGGSYYRIRVTPQISSRLTGNTVTELTVGLKGAPDSERHNLADPDDLQPYGFMADPKKAYAITIIIRDKISGQVLRDYTLKGKQRDLVMNHRGGLTHLGVGTTPEEEDVNSVELPKDGVFLLGGIPVQAFSIPLSGYTDGRSFEKDFIRVDNTERTAPVNAAAYFAIAPADMENYSNYPVMSAEGHDDFYKYYGWGGLRTVTILDEHRALVQVLEFQPKPGRIWFNARVKTPTEIRWSGWRYHPPTVI